MKVKIYKDGFRLTPSKNKRIYLQDYHNEYNQHGVLLTFQTMEKETIEAMKSGKVTGQSRLIKNRLAVSQIALSYDGLEALLIGYVEMKKRLIKKEV